jgi:hypothetical protein
LARSARANTHLLFERSTVPRSDERARPSLWLFFLCCAGVLELLYLLLFALTPLPGLHLSSTPIGEQWTWTMRPAQLLSAAITNALHASPYQGNLASWFLGAVLIGLTGMYAWAVAVLNKHPQEEKAQTYWFWLLFGSTCIFGLTLLFQPSLLSDDVFTYIFSGRILAVHGADPLNTAPIQFATDPYIKWVISGRSSPNIFGPLWLCLSALLASLSNQPAVTLLFFKGVALLAHLANCILVWQITGIIAPRRRLLCTVLYAWNPLAVIELAGSGHNEGVFIFLLLLAIFLYLRAYVMAVAQQSRKTRATIWSHHQGRPQTSFTEPGRPQGSPLQWTNVLRCCALLLLGSAMSTNLIALLFVPLIIWFDVRTEPDAQRVCWKASRRLAIILIPVFCFFLPFWRGASTFFAITSAMDMAHFVHAPIGLLTGPLHAIFSTVAHSFQFPLVVQPSLAADVTLRASATFIFALIYLHLFRAVRRAPTTQGEAHAHPDRDREMRIPGFDVLLGSLGICAFWYMVLVSGWFWPWYLLWMLWIIVLQRLTIFTSAMLVLSGTALLIYPFVGFSSEPMATYQAALIFGLPLVYLILAWSHRRHVERISHAYEQRSETAQD